MEEYFMLIADQPLKRNIYLLKLPEEGRRQDTLYEVMTFVLLEN